MVYRIFLVEDDYLLAKVIAEQLSYDNYEVIQPNSFKTIDREIIQQEPDLVLLDLQLPYDDGYQICRRVREKSKIPIIIISARNQDFEQMLALEIGADDYVTKPFSPELLHIKIRAVIRRIYGEYAKKENTQIYKGLSLNNNYIVSYQSNQLELSKNESLLLQVLISNAEQYVERATLINEVWGTTQFIDDNTLTVNITRLKSALAELGLVNVIQSKRSVGYRIVMK